MFLRAASEDRPYHLGSFPEEVLPRDARVRRDEAARPASAMLLPFGSTRGPFGSAVRRYHELFAEQRIAPHDFGASAPLIQGTGCSASQRRARSL